MPHYGTLHDFAFRKDIDDIRGTTLYGLEEDQKLGKIDDVIFDHETGAIKYVVVDSGGWLTHKKFLIPAERVHEFGNNNDDNAFQADLTKAQIEQFPRYDESAMKSDQNWAEYEGHYREHWKANPIQHRQDRIDRDVTPVVASAEEAPQARTERELAREDAEGKFTPTRLQGKFPEPAQTSRIEMVPAGPSAATEEPLPDEFPIVENPPAGPTQQARDADIGKWHPRMRKFEEVLKENRVDVTASCPSCAPGKKAA